MTTRFVGIGGSDANSGLTYALRKLTLNGVEDSPVVAGDVVYCAPGTYRESLAVDVAGTAGNPISYIGDESGILTDGIGGPIRITGSDNDQTATRANAIVSDQAYRTWRGLHIDTTTGAGIAITAANNIVEQCVISNITNAAITVSGASQATTLIRRCLIYGGVGGGIAFSHSSVLDNQASVVENCLFYALQAQSVSSTRVGGITVRNCSFFGVLQAIRILTALTVGQVLTANNNIIYACNVGLQATIAAEFVEDYNNLLQNSTARTNVTAGANSKTYPPLLKNPLLTLGIVVPYPGQLDVASLLAAIAGTGVAADDLYGTTRVATSSFGATQYEATRRPNDAGYPRSRINE